MIENKVCTICKKLKHITSFHKKPRGECKECTRELHRVRYKDNKRAGRESHLLRAYGLSIKEFDEILAAQKNLCKICLSPNHNGKNWHVDHDSSLNKIRGILCHNCNLGLGGLNTKDKLLQAIEYIGNDKDWREIVHLTIPRIIKRTGKYSKIRELLKDKINLRRQKQVKKGNTDWKDIKNETK